MQTNYMQWSHWVVCCISAIGTFIILSLNSLDDSSGLLQKLLFHCKVPVLKQFSLSLDNCRHFTRRQNAQSSRGIVFWVLGWFLLEMQAVASQKQEKYVIWGTLLMKTFSWEGSQTVLQRVQRSSYASSDFANTSSNTPRSLHILCLH